MAVDVESVFVGLGLAWGKEVVVDSMEEEQEENTYLCKDLVQIYRRISLEAWKLSGGKQRYVPTTLLGQFYISTIP